MSADGLSGLAVDDLGRSLQGWQMLGWQFEIPHAPLTATLLEPGATPGTPPEFAPVPGNAPAVAEDAPESDAAPGDADTGAAALLETRAPAAIDTDDAPRESLRGLDGGLSAGPDYEAAIAPGLASAGDAPAAGGGGGGFNVLAAFEAVQSVVEDIADFFEFNIIFQLNVLLDSDFVAHEVVAASDPSLFGLGFGQWAFTGGNTQSNSALIVDADDYGDFGWLGGGYHETNAIYSFNALDDGDIAFNLVSGLDLSGVQSIASGGNVQTNEAAIYSLTGGIGPVPEGVQIGPNDTVEYNITTQINFMNDSDIVSQHIGGGSGAQTASTGGNSQSNAALLVDDNAAPGHDVPGNYYEYNLIVQANFMDDGDHAGQFVDAGTTAQQMLETGLYTDDETLPHGLYGEAFV